MEQAPIPSHIAKPARTEFSGATGGHTIEDIVVLVDQNRCDEADVCNRIHDSTHLHRINPANVARRHFEFNRIDMNEFQFWEQVIARAAGAAGLDVCKVTTPLLALALHASAQHVPTAQLCFCRSSIVTDRHS